MINRIKHIAKSWLVRIEPYRKMHRQVMLQGQYPPGHFYSPVPDLGEVEERFSRLDRTVTKLADVNLRSEEQLLILQEYQGYYRELPFTEKPTDGLRYHYDQGNFCYSDAIFLYCFLRANAPRRIIEVGSGYSSAVMLDTLATCPDLETKLTFIEPHPEVLLSILKKEDFAAIDIKEMKVQDVPCEVFATLEAGDLLFIDSSHVVKCGSDVQYLLFEVVPTLPPGVFVHFHDIFHPFEYPSEWVTSGRYWNELYFIRAFLAYNDQWAIRFFNSYVGLTYEDYLREHMPLCLKNTGGSLYVQRVMDDR